MIENTNDLRAKRTEKALFDAFRKLASERPLREISVKELTENAGINRKTFYIHYHDIEGFIFGLKQRFIQDVAIYMGSVLEEKDARTAFHRTLLYLAEDPEWSHLLLSTSDYGQIWKMLEDPTTRPWDFGEFIPDIDNQAEVILYLIGALKNLFCVWYETGMRMTPDEMASFGTRIVFYGIFN